VEFGLRKSRLRTNLIDFQQYFPDKPDQTYIDDAIKQLQKLGMSYHSRINVNIENQPQCNKM
jgi:hypothetical protein